MLVKKESGRLDCLVNNAGMMQDALIGMIDEKSMRDVFEVNVFAVMLLTQFAARVMMRQNSGSIINLASIVGINGNKGQLVYSATKGAVIAMSKTAAKELAHHNIRVNAVAPGMIDTDIFRSIGEEKVADRLKNIGMGRLGTPTDVANVCVYLASDLSEYVTGQIIGVDGAAII
jgi:3-oxoacyl-[acyl-carrier protein] reductase